MGSVEYEIADARKKAMWLYPKVMGFNPSERWGHSACYYQGSVYFYGGCCGGMHFSDVLVLNLDTMVWKIMETIGEKPGPRDSHSAVLVKNRMIIFGGTNGSRKLNHLHILDLDTREWTHPECEGNSPSPRESHSATLVGDDKLVIFGGSGEGEANYLNDLHVLHLETMRWSRCEARGFVPTPRDSHSVVVVGNKFFVYGGDCGDQYHGDIEMLDMDSLTWSKFVIQGSSPGIRAGHATLNIGKKIYVIGGVGDKHYYSDAWVLDLRTRIWSRLNICGQKPQGRFSHTAVVAGSDIVIYGGCGEDERPLNELLILQLGDEHPNGRYNISMCKIFQNHRNRDKGVSSSTKTRITSGHSYYDLESGRKESFRFLSEPKRRRTSIAPMWEVESVQEEHSLSLSRHSSPSLSDQDQTALRKSNDSATSSREFHFLNSSNILNRPTQEQCQSEQHMDLGAGLHSLIGAGVTGKVDGAFDSGFLIGATVNGKAYRGVLFTPAKTVFSGSSAVSDGLYLARPISDSSKVEPCRQSWKQPIACQLFESIQSLPRSYDQLGQTGSITRATPSPCSYRDSSDLEGVVLTLGSPGNFRGGSK